MVHGALTRDCLLREGPQGARVADFGVGVALYEAGVLGACGEKVPEAAPEVKAGAEPTTASDVYALGIIGIELCAVPSPAGAASTQDSPAETARHIPGAGLAAVLARAIESDPKARQPSAEEMLAQLRKIAIRPPPAPSARVTRKLPTPKPKKEPEPPAVPEMSYLRGLGLLLWGLTRSALILTMALSLIAAAVVGGLALAFRNTPALVTVPDLEGMTVAEATALARAKGLEVTVGREAHHEEVPAGHVIDHSPYPGKMVREGRAVELVVSLGPPRAKVPNLVGKSRAEARDLLTAARLRLGTVSRQARSSKPGDEVLSQNPGPGKEVPIDTEVSLTVSGNRKIASAPGVKGPRAADVAIIVPEGPVVQRVKVEVHYPSGRYEVAYERVCRPGEKVRTHVTASGEATVQVLIDGELVAEYDLEPSP